jgi:hypothetical protein
MDPQLQSSSDALGMQIFEMGAATENTKHSRHRQFPRHKTGCELLERSYARYFQKQEGIGPPSALKKHCDSNSSTELLQRPTAMGHHLYAWHIPVAPEGTFCAQLNTRSYTGTKIDMSYLTLS